MSLFIAWVCCGRDVDVFVCFLLLGVTLPTRGREWVIPTCSLYNRCNNSRATINDKVLCDIVLSHGSGVMEL